MRTVLGLSLTLAAMLATAPAQAGEGLGHARWCETDTSAPAQAPAMAAVAPDGKLRGTRSAAVLVAEAKSAAKAGRDEEALAWLRLCQWHNQDAQNAIGADRADVLSWLNS
jgi:hypothetical protein